MVAEVSEQILATHVLMTHGRFVISALITLCIIRAVIIIAAIIIVVQEAIERGKDQGSCALLANMCFVAHKISRIMLLMTMMMDK